MPFGIYFFQTFRFVLARQKNTIDLMREILLHLTLCVNIHFYALLGCALSEPLSIVGFPSFCMPLCSFIYFQWKFFCLFFSLGGGGVKKKLLLLLFAWPSL